MFHTYARVANHCDLNLRKSLRKKDRWMAKLTDQYSEEKFGEFIKNHFTPSDVIRTPTKLFGRNGALSDIERAFQSPGRHVFVYGDRGVGKSSVAETAAFKLNEYGDPIVIQCTRKTTLFEAIQDIASSVYDRSDRFDPPTNGRNVQLTIPGTGRAEVGGKKASRVEVPKPKSLNECFDLLRYVDQKTQGQTVIVLDEFDNIQDTDVLHDFAEFMKGLPTISDTGLKFTFCGIFLTLDELIARHRSIGRQFETIALEPVSYGNLFHIVEAASEEIGIEIGEAFLTRIAVLSDRFPHFVHLFGMYVFWHLFDIEYEGEEITRSHYKHGVKSTLSRAEPELRLTYDKAIRKYSHADQYELALWAFADRGETMSQMKKVYTDSYLRIAGQLGIEDEEFMEPKDFGRRVYNLKLDRHGNILIPALDKSGWYQFRENRMRGFCRLKADQAGAMLCEEWIADLTKMRKRGQHIA